MKDEKIKFLRKICNCELLNILSNDEIKLYLLLLAYVKGFGEKEFINIEIIRKCLGSDFTIKRLKKASSSLMKHKLTKIDFSHYEKRVKGYSSKRDSINSEMSFELYDISNIGENFTSY